ncbi:MAG: very short patch repair endonuclease [Chloroflexi bacterium]|nr:very short patch repair endonuclease [Chloroflexota bacterium]
MAAIRSKNTRPEWVVRRALHAAGFRFRLHRKDLPGKPDIVLPRYHTVVFVHGCFWHGHECADGHIPRTNTPYWAPKLEGNRVRDQKHKEELEALGWTVETVFACQTQEAVEGLIRRLKLSVFAAPQPNGRGTC